MTNKEVAEAISKHNFHLAYEYFAQDIMWVLPGGKDIHGKENVQKTCEESAEYLAKVKTTFDTFKTHVTENSVIIESAASYDDNGEVSYVASCDVYEFAEEKLVKITSYNIEVPQEK